MDIAPQYSEGSEGTDPDVILERCVEVLRPEDDQIQLIVARLQQELGAAPPRLWPRKYSSVTLCRFAGVRLNASMSYYFFFGYLGTVLYSENLELLCSTCIYR